MRKKNKIIIFLSLIIFSFTVITYFLNIRSNDDAVYFFKSIGQFSVFKGNNFNLSLAFIAKKDTNIIKDIKMNSINSIRFNENNTVEIRDFQIIPAKFEGINVSEWYRIRNIDFNYLNLDLYLPENYQMNNITLESIQITTPNQIHTFDIGSIVIKTNEYTHENKYIEKKLALKSNRGLNFSSGLKSYSATYINKSDTNMYLNSIDFGMFSYFNPSLKINNTEITMDDSDFTAVIIKPDDNFTIEIGFTENIHEYNAYYFAPEFEILYDDQSNMIFTTHCISGISLSVNELEYIFKQIYLK